LVAPVEREREALAILDRWPAGMQAVLVGGYAVSAYALPRFSVDLDLVADRDQGERVEEWLKSEDFRLGKRWKSGARESAAAVSRWNRAEVTVDVLSGAVRDREAAVDVPAEWVMRAPQARRLVLQAASTTGAHPVCRPEALFALKLQAGRVQDLSDLLVLQGVPVDVEEVRALFSSLWCPSLSRKLEKVRGALGSEKLFRDACSRRELGSPDLPANRREWKALRGRVDAAIPTMGAP